MQYTTLLETPIVSSAKAPHTERYLESSIRTEEIMKQAQTHLTNPRDSWVPSVDNPENAFDHPLSRHKAPRFSVPVDKADKRKEKLDSFGEDMKKIAREKLVVPGKGDVGHDGGSSRSSKGKKEKKKKKKKRGAKTVE